MGDGLQPTSGQRTRRRSARDGPGRARLDVGDRRRPVAVALEGEPPAVHDRSEDPGRADVAAIARSIPRPGMRPFPASRTRRRVEPSTSTSIAPASSSARYGIAIGSSAASSVTTRSLGASRPSISPAVQERPLIRLIVARVGVAPVVALESGVATQDQGTRSRRLGIREGHDLRREERELRAGQRRRRSPRPVACCHQDSVWRSYMTRSLKRRLPVVPKSWTCHRACDRTRAPCGTAGRTSPRPACRRRCR